MFFTNINDQDTKASKSLSWPDYRGEDCTACTRLCWCTSGVSSRPHSTLGTTVWVPRPRGSPPEPHHQPNNNNSSFIFLVTLFTGTSPTSICLLATRHRPRPSLTSTLTPGPPWTTFCRNTANSFMLMSSLRYWDWTRCVLPGHECGQFLLTHHIFQTTYECVWV